MIYALVGAFLLSLVVLGATVWEISRERRRHRRIARAHEPRPFRKPLAPPDNPSNRSA